MTLGHNEAPSGLEIAPPTQSSRSFSRKFQMEVLNHLRDECTGNWRLMGAAENRTITCDQCGAQFQATPENRLAAIDENYAGIYLRRLTAEGITLGADTSLGD